MSGNQPRSNRTPFMTWNFKFTKWKLQIRISPCPIHLIVEVASTTSYDQHNMTVLILLQVFHYNLNQVVNHLGSWI